MASSLNTPDVLTQPIAENGDKNTIPSTNDQSLGQMSQSTGFPAICSERIADGGKAPRRADFNGVFNMLSRYIFFKQNGGIETFRADVSTAIGGYPKDAILGYKTATEFKLVRSLIANNTYNFNTNPSYIDDGTHWESVIPMSKNIADWSSNVTNCITEIPQDIKLELSSGSLVFKAGTKAYLGDGTPVTVANDFTWGAPTGYPTGRFVISLTSDGTAFFEAQFANCVSAASNPGTGYIIWFNTTDSKCYHNDANGVATECTFPIAIVHITNGTGITSIEKTFNGFGYIGSTIFVLPGVKGLIPNGRNSDGTLKNTLLTKQSVNVFTPTSATFSQVTNIALGSALSYHTFTYNEAKNINSAPSYMNAGDVTWSNGKITYFAPKTVFHAVDYYDLAQTQNNISTFVTDVLDTLYPVGSIYIGTQATCPLAALIPGSAWTAVQGRYLLASGTLAGTTETYSATSTVAAGLPNITGTLSGESDSTPTGAFARGTQVATAGGGAGKFYEDTFDASRSSTVYGNSTTNRPAAYVVNVWRRNS